ncbi:hypothetical protein SLA2020_149380 [Shorea laevis]
MAKAKDFADDLIRDIIGRLSDPKSVCRFKSVSKSWRSMISEIKREDLVILSRSGVYSADLDSPHILKQHFVPHGGEPVILRGSCNSLILLSSHYNIILWNKFSGDYQLIPYPEIISSEPYYKEDSMFLLYGLGYDSVDDDYKIVQIIWFCCVNHCLSKFEFKVYSLRNKTWRSPKRTSIKSSPAPYIMGSYFNMSKAALVGSSVHWAAHYEQKSQYLVFAFDLTTEESHEIELPEKTKADVVGTLEGNLTVTHSKNELVDIWVMKEYKVKASWTHAFRIPIVIYRGIYVSNCIRPIAYSRNCGQKMLLECGDCSLLWYDLGKNKLDVVGINDHQVDEIYGITLCSYSQLRKSTGNNLLLKPS